jgi:hypothetical protein
MDVREVLFYPYSSFQNVQYLLLVKKVTKAHSIPANLKIPAKKNDRRVPFLTVLACAKKSRFTVDILQHTPQDGQTANFAKSQGRAPADFFLVR